MSWWLLLLLVKVCNCEDFNFFILAQLKVNKFFQSQARMENSSRINYLVMTFYAWWGLF